MGVVDEIDTQIFHKALGIVKIHDFFFTLAQIFSPFSSLALRQHGDANQQTRMSSFHRYANEKIKRS